MKNFVIALCAFAFFYLVAYANVLLFFCIIMAFKFPKGSKDPHESEFVEMSHKASRILGAIIAILVLILLGDHMFL